MTAGGGDVVVAKFAANGAHQWSKRFGDASNQYSADVAVDSVGDVIVTGGFVGTIDLGGGPRISAGAEDIFLTKLAADGSHMWSLRFGDPADHQTPQSVVVDPSSGAIALAGYFEGTIDFGGGPLVSAAYLRPRDRGEACPPTSASSPESVGVQQDLPFGQVATPPAPDPAAPRRSLGQN